MHRRLHQAGGANIGADVSAWVSWPLNTPHARRSLHGYHWPACDAWQRSTARCRRHTRCLHMTAMLVRAATHLVVAARAAAGRRGVGAVLKVERRRLKRLGHAGVQLEAGAAQQLVALREQPVVRRDQPAAVLLQLLRAPGARRVGRVLGALPPAPSQASLPCSPCKCGQHVWSAGLRGLRACSCARGSITLQNPSLQRTAKKKKKKVNRCQAPC